MPCLNLIKLYFLDGERQIDEKNFKNDSYDGMVEWHKTVNKVFPFCSVYARRLPIVQEGKLGWKVLICKFISLSGEGGEDRR